MTLNVSDFRTAARQLGATDSIRLTTDGKGVATTKWERFKVSVNDFFSSSATVKARQQEAVVQLKEALRREYGRELGDLAAHNVERAMKRGPLTAQVVDRALSRAEARGGQHHMRNEQIIRALSQSLILGPRHLAEPIEQTERYGSLSGILNQVAPDILRDAEEAGLSRGKLDELRRELDTTGERGRDIRRIPDVTDAIETALREASIDREESQRQGKTCYRPLDPQEAREIATRTVEKVLRSSVNQALLVQFRETQPYEERLNQRLAEENLDGFAEHLDVSTRNGDKVVYAAMNADRVLGREDLARLTEQTIDRQVAVMRGKLDGIERLELPEGVEKRELVAMAMSSGSSMNETAFQALRDLSGDIRDGLRRIATAENQQQVDEILLELALAAKQRIEEAGVSGGDDANNFVGMAMAMVLAREPRDEPSAIRTLLGDDRVGELRDRLTSLTPSVKSKDSRLAGPITLFMVGLGIGNDIGKR